MSDSSAAGTSSVTISMGQVDASHLGTANGVTTVSIAGTNDNLSTASAAQATLTDINNAIAGVAGLRGTLGASSNQLSAATNVMNNQVQNLTSAENGIMGADIGQTTANLSQYSILQQTGIAALHSRTRCSNLY